MLAAWWLALAGPPVFDARLRQAADVPAALALAEGRVHLRRRCLSLRCLRAGWSLPQPARGAFARPASPFAIRPVLPRTGGIGLFAPPSRRDWIASEGHDWRVGTRYGFEAIRQPGTELRVEIGGGYRFQPGVDDGTAAMGPVARGHLALSQRIGPRARLSQQLVVEQGRMDTYVRNAVALDLLLEPRWTLRSAVELQRDSAAARGTTAGTLQLRYAF